MSNKVTVITKFQVKQDKNQEFIQWQGMLHEVISKIPGYISQTTMEPTPPIQPNWIIIQYFISEGSAKDWLQSKKRQELLKEVLPLLMGIDDVYLVDENKHGQNVAIATISAKIDPKAEQKFLDWQIQRASILSNFLGFLGYKLERPRSGIHDSWIALITFDSEEHLDVWLNSHDRQQFIETLNTLSSQSHIEKTSRGFDFWFNTGKQRSSLWKENMLVLLALYPVVFLLSYVQNFVMNYGMPFWLVLFFGNAASTAILGWIAVPWLMKHFTWWINPSEKYLKRNTVLGMILVIAFYAMSLVFCWLLSRISL